MGEVMIRLKPGVDVETTPSLSEAAINQSNLIRFRSGLPEKLGGWTSYYPFSVGGVPKALHPWLDANENQYLAVGTTTLLGAISDGSLNDITPQTLISDFSPDFTTVSTTTTVTVTDPNINTVTTLDSVEFLTPVSVGGIILSGVYPIDLVLGATSYQITAKDTATASDTNAGDVPLFHATSGSATIVVELADHGVSIGSKVNFPIETLLTGGVSILGTYTVFAVADADNFSIGISEQATASEDVPMNGGDAELKYYITLGPATGTTGYGIGTYGSGGYGTGSATGQQPGTPITTTNWTLDNWGEILLANPDGGGLYQWRPNLGLQNAQLVVQAPIHNTGMFVSMQTQMVICYGATADLTLQFPKGIGLDFDPLLVAWCNNGDFTDFTISTVSQAGSRRLPTGSKIIGGLSVPNQELLFTDLDLWAMSYLGTLENGVWGFNKIGSSCGLIGRHAVARLGANVYWMSGSNFFLLGGGAPQVIPCSVWDVVFQDLNTATDPDTNRPYSAKSWAWANTPFNEVWFFFPRASTNATEPDFFVKYNTLENVWDYGPMDRTAGIDQSIVGMPIAATSGGIIYEHETSPDADGQPLNSWMVTGLYQLSEGQDLMFVDWFFPDFVWKYYASSGGSASIQITFYSYKYLSDTPRTQTFTVTSATPYFNPRVRGRFVAIRIESNDLGSFWRLGGCRARTAIDGRL